MRYRIEGSFATTEPHTYNSDDDAKSSADGVRASINYLLGTRGIVVNEIEIYDVSAPDSRRKARLHLYEGGHMNDLYVVVEERYGNAKVVDNNVLGSERDGNTFLETCTYAAKHGDKIRLYRLTLVEEREIGWQHVRTRE